MVNEYGLYKIVEGAIAIVSLIIVYLGIQIALTWKYMKNDEAISKNLLSDNKRFMKSSIFISIAGFFMVGHEFLKGLGTDAVDYVVYEIFDLIAIMGFLMFFYEWYNILNIYKVKK